MPRGPVEDDVQRWRELSAGADARRNGDSNRRDSRSEIAWWTSRQRDLGPALRARGVRAGSSGAFRLVAVRGDERG
eukprot:2205560-Pyramimonas_sp.AAC.1